MILFQKHNKKSWTFVKLIVFALLLASGRACMVPLDNLYYELLLTLVCFFYMRSNNMLKFKQTQVTAAILLCMMSVYTMHGSPNFTAYGGMLVAVLMPAILIGLKTKIKIELFDDISNWMAVLLLLSITAWGLHLAGVPLPHTSQTIELEESEHYYVLDNYYLFRTAIQSNIIDLEFPRFNGFFQEPGHMGTILAFFLYANGFDLKKRRNLIYLIAIALTLSAAAYAIAAIGYILYKAASGSSKLAVRALLLVALLISFAQLYNNGDNIVNELILGKLTREEGALDGRISLETQDLYQKLWDEGKYIFGLGYIKLSSSAGFKVFFVMNGIFGVILVILSYFNIYKTSISKYSFYMFILYMINFTQRTYCVWDAFLVPFILGIVYINYNISQKQLQAS